MKSKIEALQRGESLEIIEEIKVRVRNVNYLEKRGRDDSLDYICAKVKAQISPILRLARKIRRGYYMKWVEFNELLEYFGMRDVLTRENNYSPMPVDVANHWDSMRLLMLEDHIFFFNKLHEIENARTEKLFEKAFENWARPALIYAFNKADTSKSEKEIVNYVCKAFYTKYIEIRAKSQGINRMRRNGQWVYYYVYDINEFDFLHDDVMRVIFHGEKYQKYKELGQMAESLTKNQTKLLIQLHNYVREDVAKLTTTQFYEKYPHERMNYKKTAEELGYSYHAFIKNVERMKGKIV
ncbi:hypothetical protein KW850_32365 [Bacillus sp. sid0103]|uniref:hypothetical protein n=1 Tax=Bacillus sp. sid0103 TaxID=2856337 RepID=UPI001C442B82|nr:hypothetical protein [Bacillus sp. sid0103]MBV7509774.1 hypothetical protein [Bacillus sp. sid0103]